MSDVCGIVGAGMLQVLAATCMLINGKSSRDYGVEHRTAPAMTTEGPQLKQSDFKMMQKHTHSVENHTWNFDFSPRLVICAYELSNHNVL